MQESLETHLVATLPVMPPVPLVGCALAADAEGLDAFPEGRCRARMPSLHDEHRGEHRKHVDVKLRIHPECVRAVGELVNRPAGACPVTAFLRKITIHLLNRLRWPHVPGSAPSWLQGVCVVHDNQLPVGGEGPALSALIENEVCLVSLAKPPQCFKPLRRTTSEGDRAN